jgi:hypothetical protein
VPQAGGTNGATTGLIMLKRTPAFRLGLLEHGWVEGRNLETHYCWGGADTNRTRAYAAELTALNPDVIFAPSVALAEVQRITRTIPVVFAQISDPVGAGICCKPCSSGRQYHWLCGLQICHGREVAGATQSNSTHLSYGIARVSDTPDLQPRNWRAGSWNAIFVKRLGRLVQKSQ